MEKRISIKDYAEINKISIPTVYKRIDKGFIKIEKEGRSVFIIVDDVECEKKEEKKESFEVEILQEKIKHLEDTLKRETEARERVEADKRELYKQLEQSNILQLKAFETVKQLEHKTEEIKDELIKEKSKTWFQKLFNIN